MNTKKKSIFNHNLTSLIVSSFVFITMIPLILICIYAYMHLSKNIRNEYYHQVNQIVSGMDKNLEIYFNEIRKTTDGVFAAGSIQKLLKEANQTGTINNECEQEALAYIYTTYGGRGDISRISLYSMNELICEKNFIHIRKLNPDDDSIKKIMEQKDGAFSILGARYQNSSKEHTKNVLTVGRMIKDLENGTAIGFLVIDIDYGMFKKMVAMPKNTSIGTLVIVDGNEQIVYNSDEDKDILKEYDSSSAFLEHQSKTKWQDVEIKSMKLDWNYHMLSDGEIVLAELNRVARMIMILGVVSFFALLGIALLIAHSVTKPIKRLDMAMEHAEEIRFNEIIPTYSTIDEINHLIRRFNVMQVEIRRLLEEERKLHKKQAETEYKALQMQITPHFLYNALDTINCLAQINNQPEISEMIIGLGNIFKYNVKYDFTLVTLQDEINHVKNYELLQAIRYQDCFAISYEVEEKYLKHYVTKFMLQPIVENAISHGMKGIDQNGIIRISAKQNDKMFQIIVEDNGNGMDQEAEERLRKLIQKSSEELFHSTNEKGGIGIANVNLRLKLQYGEKAGIQFTTKLGEGTRMIICIPEE